MDFVPKNSPLPIDAALPDLTAALRAKTPPSWSPRPAPARPRGCRWCSRASNGPKARRILVLEPRRLAARAAAERMAQTLGERVGDTVGLRVRFGSKISRKTRIEIVTEGVFTRLVLDDPMLDGVAAVLFDEFHERSLDADLGLALARDVQQGLREDLRLLVMSATIDGARVAALLGDAPVIESVGRAFPVETRYAGRDARAIEPQVADAIVRAMRIDRGSLLAFLPGAAEIRRTQALLEGRLDPAIDVAALYGALAGDEQDRAIAPAPPGRRKIVLATSIAETSITIEGVRIVIDSGLARVPRYEPDVGLTRLETVRVSRAAADQRRGRAGRTEPGICYRLWDEPQTAALEPFARPEILAADLSSFALDLAAWGTGPENLAFLDPPPRPALAEAKTLLAALGAIDGDGRITEEGRHLRRLPLAPRLARMVVDAAARRARRRRRGSVAGRRDRRPHRRARPRRRRRGSARSPRRAAPRPLTPRARRPRDGAALGVATMSLQDRERRARSRDNPAPLPARGRGAASGRGADFSRRPARACLSRAHRQEPRRRIERVFAGERPRRANRPRLPPRPRALPRGGRACRLGGAGRILLAAPITLAEIEARFADRIEAREEVTFDAASASLRGRRSRRLGALTLSDQPVPVVPSDETAQKLADGIASVGIDRLPWTKSLRQWRDRVMFLRTSEGDKAMGTWPDLSDAALAKTASQWLAPTLAAKTALGEITADELEAALSQLLPWQLKRRLDAEAPTHFAAPTGSRVPIDYQAEGGPKIAIRVQELFGLDRHPAIAGGGKVPLLIELLSPAHRPVQMTRDLPGFWRGSYAAVRAEMRGRYPKHPWPEDPVAATATRRAKPRKP